MIYVVLCALLGLVCFGLAGLNIIIRRIYKRKLAAAQAKTAQSWADYQEVVEMAARWKRLYHNLKEQA